MKTNIQVRLQMAVLAIVCGIMLTGCWPAHSPSGYRVIHQLAKDGDAAGIATELTQHPDELNMPEDGGITPLHLAAENCHSNVVALLLDKGARIDIQDTNNNTPLHLAAQQNCTDVVTLLLARNAKVNLRDKQGRTPLKRAEEWKQDAMVQLLRQHGGTE